MVIKILLKIVLNLLPIFLMTIGRFENYAIVVFDFFGFDNDTISLNSFMLFCFILGLVMIYIYYPIRFELLSAKLKMKNKNLKELSKELRNIFCKTLGKEVSVHKLRLNVRIFKKRAFYRKPFKYWLKFNKKYFQAHDFDFLNDTNSLDGSCFQVSPVQRGLVGVAFAKEKIVYDDKLTQDDRKSKYNLNNSQKSNSVIANTDFAIAKPVMNNGKLKSIITFDTEQDVEVPDKNRVEIQNLMIYYSDLFSKLITSLN